MNEKRNTFDIDRTILHTYHKKTKAEKNLEEPLPGCRTVKANKKEKPSLTKFTEFSSNILNSKNQLKLHITQC